MAALDFMVNIKAETGALAKLERELATTAKGLRSASDALEMMQARAATGNNKITPAQILSYQRLTDKIAGARSKMLLLQGAIDAQGGSEGAAGVSTLGEAFAGLPGIIAGVVTAIGAMGVAIGGLLIKGALFAIEMSDAQRVLKGQFEALLGSKEAAESFANELQNIRSKGVIADDTLIDVSKSLANAGYKSDALTSSLESVTDVAAVLGEDKGKKAADAFAKIAAEGGKLKVTGDMIKDLGLPATMKDTNVTAEQLAKTLKDKFGKGAAAAGLTLSAQMRGLKANLSNLFSGVDVESFEKALHGVLVLFDQNTNSGKALKAMITGLFNGVLSAAESALPLVKRFIQGIIIGALKLVIYLAPAIKQLNKFLGLTPNGDLEDFFERLGEVAVPALAVMAGVVGIVVVGLGILAAIALVCTAAILAIVGAAVAFSAAIAFAVAWAGAKLAMLGVAAINAGIEFTNGLVQGIESGAAAVVNAVKNLADKAIGGFKAKFGIASPSKVMAQMGQHMMSGFEVGVDKGSDGATSALSGAVDTRRIASGSGGAGAGGATINVTFGDVNLSGSGSEQAAQFKAMVIETFEQLGLQLGAVA